MLPPKLERQTGRKRITTYQEKSSGAENSAGTASGVGKP